MPDPADDARPDETAAETLEQPSEDASHNDAAPQKKRARSHSEWQVFVRENARLLITLALFGTGVIFVILGWYGAAHTNIATEQVPYLISGGLLGLGLIIVAGVMAAGAAQERSNDEFRREIARALAAIGSGLPDGGIRTDAFSTNGHTTYVVPGGRSYHVAGCPILEGKEGVKELEPAQAIASGYAACKLCGTD